MMILIAGPYASGTNGDPDLMRQNLGRLEQAAWPLFPGRALPMIGEWVALRALKRGRRRPDDPSPPTSCTRRPSGSCSTATPCSGSPGESKGADQDVAIARERGLPVYTSITEIPQPPI